MTAGNPNTGPLLRVVTINILVDLSRWRQRRDLLVQQINALAPDVLALQEVKLPENPAAWLAEQTGLQHLALTPKLGFESQREAIAILSRQPFQATDWLDLGGQQRVAQAVRLEIAGRPLALANGHFYWQPGESSVRLAQIERLIDWMQGQPDRPPCIICGDFNGTPDTRAIQRMAGQYLSAHAAVHGREPDFTCPTPLPRAPWANLRTFLGFFLLIRPRHLDLNWHGVLDYIFVDRRLQVEACRVVLDQPSPADPNIYPSDHFGLYAEVRIP